jgi:DNA recombination protein RmuC
MRPDLVVRLPGGRNIVVDAKVPLGAYLEAREATDEETRAAKLRQHAAQVQAHVAKLGAKSYWEGFASRPELVLMFMPAEPLYSQALEQMPSLLEEGVAQGVMIATPTTLLALLRALSYGWREERLAENAQRISEEGRRLHERVATVLEHLGDLGRSLGSSVKHFNQALASFNGRVTVSARRLEELDVRGKKSLVEAEEIEVRPSSVKLSSDGNPERVPEPSRDGLRSASRAESTRGDRTRPLPRQPMLTLAPPPARDADRDSQADG